MAQWEAFQKIWAKRLREMSDGIRKQTETVHYTVFESMQTMMDYIEESLQNIMLPPSEGKFHSHNILTLFPIFVLFSRVCQIC